MAIVNSPAASVEDLHRLGQFDLVPWESVPKSFHESAQVLFVEAIPKDINECRKRFRLSNSATYSAVESNCGLLKDKGFTGGHRLYVVPGA